MKNEIKAHIELLFNFKCRKDLSSVQKEVGTGEKDTNCFPSTSSQLLPVPF